MSCSGVSDYEANAIVAPIHPKAMPVVLTSATEVDRWLEEDTCGP
jgi:putative SOS response-associated peptidase YedK